MKPGDRITSDADWDALPRGAVVEYELRGDNRPRDLKRGTIGDGRGVMLSPSRS